ncbi:MAG: SHOCT domain-containing protein, partial [Schwartzia sp.]|nr:SHOCT domain-containing protein [Schwartzia sp. (in: firmicutes)]
AGLVLGGNSKELCCACKLDTCEEFLVSCETEECQKLKSLAQKNAGKLAKNVPVIDAQIEEKEDVMATLERLGKLRDDGVVSEDEFQQKKAELMSRL